MGTSLFGVLNMSQQSLANSQTALSVVSNNISNMNSTGYSKQTVVTNAIPAYDTYNWCSSVGSLQIGHGAEVVSVQRSRAQWLDNYFRDQNTSSGYYSQLGSMTNNVENMLNDELSSTGLQQKLSDFFTASQSLTSDPTNNAYRIAFLNSAQGVSNLLNSMSSELTTLRSQAVGTVNDADSFNNSLINMNTEEFNSKLSQLATVNGDIAQSMASGSANNDLLDKRDVILDDLSKMMPLTVTSNTNGTVNVLINNQTVVKGGEQVLTVKAIQTNNDADPVKIQLIEKDGKIKDDDISEYMTDGSLKAIIDSATDEDLSYQSVLKELDKFANAFATEINKIQTGTGADGSSPYCLSADGKKLIKSTENMFVTSDGTAAFTAANIKISDTVKNNPNLVATARGDDTIDVNAVGNTKNMELFNKLADTQIDGLSLEGVVNGKQTLSAFITSLVSDVGSKVQTVTAATESQASVLEQATTQRSSYTGVDLNQELSDLIKYQRSYEASARIFNVATQLTQLLTQLGQ